MTEKIKSAIDWFDDFAGFYSLSEDEKKMFYFAIRSLSAWEEVLTELEEKADFADCCGDMEEKLGIKGAIKIINKHLSEIEETEHNKQLSKTIEKALVENSIETTSGLTVIETQKAIDIIRQELS